MPTFFVDIHFIGFEVIELFAYWGFVFGGQSCPRFVSTTVIFVARCNFDIVIKFDYLKKKVKFFRASYFFLYFQKLNNKRSDDEKLLDYTQKKNRKHGFLVIFDDFSKFCCSIFGATHYEKSSNLLKELQNHDKYWIIKKPRSTHYSMDLIQNPKPRILNMNTTTQPIAQWTKIGKIVQ